MCCSTCDTPQKACTGLSRAPLESMQLSCTACHSRAERGTTHVCVQATAGTSQLQLQQPARSHLFTTLIPAAHCPCELHSITSSPAASALEGTPLHVATAQGPAASHSWPQTRCCRVPQRSRPAAAGALQAAPRGLWWPLAGTAAAPHSPQHTCRGTCGGWVGEVGKPGG